jgi:hypothetical protein
MVWQSGTEHPTQSRVQFFPNWRSNLARLWNLSWVLKVELKELERCWTKQGSKIVGECQDRGWLPSITCGRPRYDHELGLADGIRLKQPRLRSSRRKVLGQEQQILSNTFIKFKQDNTSTPKEAKQNKTRYNSFTLESTKTDMSSV